jgi:ankyrin repeat protein
VNIYADNELAFRWACGNGRIEIANWLVQDHQVDIHVDNEDTFKYACKYRHDKVIKWFTETYRYSQSPYYFYNNTVYILNH